MINKSNNYLEEKLEAMLSKLSSQEKNQKVFNALSPLIVGHRYLPFLHYAMDYHSIATLINDIVINKRLSVLEFGCGLSTIFMARLIKINELFDMKIVSVEHDEKWLNYIQENLSREKLDSYVDLIHAPLSKVDFVEGHTVPWYSYSILDDKLSDKKFDMIVVDGPPAFNPEISLSRLPALYYVKLKKIATDDFSLFIHDIDRMGEQQIFKAWEIELKKRGLEYTAKLAGIIGGKHFSIFI